MSSISTLLANLPPVICDFGWYYGLTPARLPELSYVVGSTTYPPGKTTLGGSSSITLPVSIIPSNFGTLAQLQAAFESMGTFILDNGINQQPVQYTGLAMSGGLPSFTGCTGGTGTFTAKTPLYDPRFYVDDAPMNMLITFDATDHLGLGLPMTVPPAGISVIRYQWDFGNGQTGLGPFTTTTYSFPIPPPDIQTTLTVTDGRGRQFSCAHRLNLQALQVIWGTAARERQSNAHYR